jgi:3-dehydroquinate synthase
MSTSLSRVGVQLPGQPAGRYDVIIRAGALSELTGFLHHAVDAAAYAVIADDNVAGIYGTGVIDQLRRAGMKVQLVTFTAGEAHKTRENWEALSDAMLAHGFGRDCCVLALGGGVTGDLAGFVAATYMRGVPVVQLPTSMLAMIDASVGGKTAVDTPAGKNLIGAFHAPRLVLIDPQLLRTLPADELRSGMAEAVKHGAILDASYFADIERDAERLLDAPADTAESLIIRSVQLKAEVASDDPFEQGRRAILNFGHTVGHAVERAAEYRISHGAAVAIGMVAEASIGEAAGVTEEGTSTRLEALLARIGLPTRLDHTSADLMDAMRLDKKARKSMPRFALLRRIGETARNDRGEWTHSVPVDLLESVFRRR